MLALRNSNKEDVTLANPMASDSADGLRTIGVMVPPSREPLLRHLRAVVLLAGVVRTTPFTESISRSVLGLPLAADTNLLRHWYDQVRLLTEHCYSDSLPFRLLVDSQSPLPVAPMTSQATPLSIERDPLEFRGTAGVLSDATAEYDPDDYVLVANAASLFVENLSEIAESLASDHADIAILAEDDGSPTGIMLVRCGTLRGTSPIGFVDLNEQALPTIASTYDVRVLHKQVKRFPIRSLSEYIAAVRHFHATRCPGRFEDGPFQESWLPSFGITEEEKSVAAGATLIDSVVLRGGRVEAGAVVVRSVVCPGAVVRARATVIDQIVTL